MFGQLAHDLAEIAAVLLNSALFSASFHLLARPAPTFSIAPLRCSRWTIDPTCSRIAARKIASGIEAFGRDHPSCSFLGAQQLSLAVRSVARQNHGSSSLPW